MRGEACASRLRANVRTECCRTAARVSHWSLGTRNQDGLDLKQRTRLPLDYHSKSNLPPEYRTQEECSCVQGVLRNTAWSVAEAPLTWFLRVLQPTQGSPLSPLTNKVTPTCPPKGGSLGVPPHERRSSKAGAPRPYKTHISGQDWAGKYDEMNAPTWM